MRQNFWVSDYGSGRLSMSLASLPTANLCNDGNFGHTRTAHAAKHQTKTLHMSFDALSLPPSGHWPFNHLQFGSQRLKHHPTLQLQFLNVFGPGERVPLLVFAPHIAPLIWPPRSKHRIQLAGNPFSRAFLLRNGNCYWTGISIPSTAAGQAAVGAPA